MHYISANATHRQINFNQFIRKKKKTDIIIELLAPSFRKLQHTAVSRHDISWYTPLEVLCPKQWVEDQPKFHCI